MTTVPSVATVSGVSGSWDVGELVSHLKPPHPSVAEAPLLAAVMFWPTLTSVIHIWSRLGTCAEVEWCWQASLTGHWCARVHVRVCALPHLAVGRTLQCGSEGPAARSPPHTLAQPLLTATWGQQQCHHVLAAGRRIKLGEVFQRVDGGLWGKAGHCSRTIGELIRS